MENTVSELIEKFGGPTVLADVFGIKPPSVYEWKARGVIPKARLFSMRLMRPDLFTPKQDEK
jgi:hypothetical protein